MLLVFQISNHLKSAHKWFKDKFDNLQDELQASRLVELMYIYRLVVVMFCFNSSYIHYIFLYT